MSFSVYLNSINGAQVSGAQNQIQYNFDFNNTPEHHGGYKVWMSFASETQTYNGTPPMFGRINIDLGVFDSYTPMSTYTATKNNQIFGLIRPSLPQSATNFNIPAVTSVGTTIIPVSTTVAAGYTQTISNVTPSSIVTNLGVQTVDARYGENPPIYLQSKPTNNLFTVKITLHDGVLYTYLTAHYALILTFEAI